LGYIIFDGYRKAVVPQLAKQKDLNIGVVLGFLSVAY
jgi:hypothetical protein